MKLHNTCQSNQYYTNFNELPKEVQKSIIDASPELICSSYTVGENCAFIRLDATIDVIDYEIEVSLGSCDIRHSDFQWSDAENDYVYDNGDLVNEDEYSEQMLQDLMEVIEFECLDVYLTANASKPVNWSI